MFRPPSRATRYATKGVSGGKAVVHTLAGIRSVQVRGRRRGRTGALLAVVGLGAVSLAACRGPQTEVYADSWPITWPCNTPLDGGVNNWPWGAYDEVWYTDIPEWITP